MKTLITVRTCHAPLSRRTSALIDQAPFKFAMLGAYILKSCVTATRLKWLHWAVNVLSLQICIEKSNRSTNRFLGHNITSKPVDRRAYNCSHGYVCTCHIILIVNVAGLVWLWCPCYYENNIGHNGHISVIEFLTAYVLVYRYIFFLLYYVNLCKVYVYTIVHMSIYMC